MPGEINAHAVGLKLQAAVERIGAVQQAAQEAADRIAKERQQAAPGPSAEATAP